jgi:hypothetical protein
VRAYDRRGSTFSERLLLDRDTLVHRLKHGKRYVSGKRVPYLGSTFEVGEDLQLAAHNGLDLLVVGQGHAEKDDLKGVPLI